MSDKIRCPACRGMKKVPKLGGMIGDCNTCSGSGSINAIDKPVPAIQAEVILASEVIAEVKNVEAIKPKLTKDAPKVDKVEALKVDGKRAIYKRKKA